MAQPHKGDRAQIMCRPVLPVYEEIRARAAARGMSMSQYAADVLAQHVGRADLVRELDDREGCRWRCEHHGPVYAAGQMDKSIAVRITP